MRRALILATLTPTGCRIPGHCQAGMSVGLEVG